MTSRPLRVYQLARRLGVSSKDVIAAVRELQSDPKNHMTTLSHEMADAVFEYFFDLRVCVVADSLKVSTKSVAEALLDLGYDHTTSITLLSDQKYSALWKYFGLQRALAARNIDVGPVEAVAFLKSIGIPLPFDTNPTPAIAFETLQFFHRLAREVTT